MWSMGHVWALPFISPLIPNCVTLLEEGNNQVVWIRLPGLSKGYNSEILLRAIGQVIGPVVKIDKHTTTTI